MDREKGFASGEDDLRRVLDVVGEGLWSWAYGDCRGTFYSLLLYSLANPLGTHDYAVAEFSRVTEIPGCEAVALTVTGGDGDTTLLTMAVLFTSERRADSGLEDLEERMEASAEFDIDVEDARVRAELAVMELTIHE